MMNENTINILLEQLPFSLTIMIHLVFLSFFILPIFSVFYIIVVIYKRIRQKPMNKAIAAVAVSTVLSLSGIYITSTKYIANSVSTYFLGEDTIEEARKYSLLTDNITSTLNPLELDELRECDKPLLIGDKYVSPRYFNLMQCLGLQ